MLVGSGLKSIAFEDVLDLGDLVRLALDHQRGPRRLEREADRAVGHRRLVSGDAHERPKLVHELLRIDVAAGVRVNAFDGGLRLLQGRATSTRAPPLLPPLPLLPPRPAPPAAAGLSYTACKAAAFAGTFSSIRRSVSAIRAARSRWACLCASWRRVPCSDCPAMLDRWERRSSPESGSWRRGACPAARRSKRPAAGVERRRLWAWAMMALAEALSASVSWALAPLSSFQCCRC